MDEHGVRPMPHLTDVSFSSLESPLSPIVRLAIVFLRVWVIVREENHRAVNGLEQFLTDFLEHMTIHGPTTASMGKPS